MLIKKLYYLILIMFILKLDIVFASNSDSRVSIFAIIFTSIVVVFNLIYYKNDKKKRMLLSNILRFDEYELEINYIIKNIIILIFILAYYFFVLPIFIDFVIATFQLVIKSIKNMNDYK